MASMPHDSDRDAAYQQGIKVLEVVSDRFSTDRHVYENVVSLCRDKPVRLTVRLKNGPNANYMMFDWAAFNGYHSALIYLVGRLIDEPRMHPLTKLAVLDRARTLSGDERMKETLSRKCAYLEREVHKMARTQPTANQQRGYELIALLAVPGQNEVQVVQEAQTILAHRADLTVQDDRGWTSFDYALAHDYESAAHMIGQKLVLTTRATSRGRDRLISKLFSDAADHANTLDAITLVQKYERAVKQEKTRYWHAEFSKSVPVEHRPPKPT